MAATLSATEVTSTSAVLRAEVRPRGLEAMAWFEWGVGSGFDHTTVPENLGRGFEPVVVSATLTDLTRGTEYHYRVVAQNSAGVDVGRTLTFRWSAAPVQIEPLSRAAPGVYTIRCNGVPGQVYLVERSMDLRRWEKLGWLEWQTGGWFEFKHTNDAGASFYRVLSP